MLPRPLMTPAPCTEPGRSRLGRARPYSTFLAIAKRFLQEPCIPGSSPRDASGILCPMFCPKFCPDPARDTIPVGTRPSRGQPAPIEAGGSGRARPGSAGRAVEGGLFTSRSSSKQLLGCGEGFPGSGREGRPPCSLPPRFAPSCREGPATFSPKGPPARVGDPAGGRAPRVPGLLPMRQPD